MNVKLNNSKHTSMDLWTRNNFLHNTVIVKKPINTTPLKLSKGNDTSDSANMGRPAFLRSNPMVYVPDFDLADELQQQNMGQKVHLSDDTVRSITGVNKTVNKLEKMLDNPYTLTQEGFNKLVSAVKKLDYPHRIELDDAVSKSGTALAARVLNELNRVAPPIATPIGAPLPALPARFLTAKDMELNYIDDEKQPDVLKRSGVFNKLPSRVKFEDELSKTIKASQHRRGREMDLDELISNVREEEKGDTDEKTKDERKQLFYKSIKEQMNKWAANALKTIPIRASPIKKAIIRNSPDYVKPTDLKKWADKMGYSGKSTNRKTLVDYIMHNATEEFASTFYPKKAKPVKVKRQRSTGKINSKKYLY